MTKGHIPGSFRDPDAFLFDYRGVLYRQINNSYAQSYDLLMRSGLYDNLVRDGLLIGHREVDLSAGQIDKAYKVISPDKVPFVSYPYEWSFSQLKSAALATLTIQARALQFGMTLKDASAYNIQFVHGKPLLIDTASFAPYRPGDPWVAYRQFCGHFLAPLALMRYTDVRLTQLLRVHLDGIPLDLAAKLLPFRSRLNFPVLLHLFAHAWMQLRMSDRTADHRKPSGTMGKHSLEGLVDNLTTGVAGLKRGTGHSPWTRYYADIIYDARDLEVKKEIVAEFLDNTSGPTVWDLGANVGVFSRIATSRGLQTVAWDSDPECVDANYRQVVENKETNLLPLVVDLANPSPSIGWENTERMSLLERGPADVVLALALVHHLSIANNVPLKMVAHFLSRLCRRLIIEFIPKDDAGVKRLMTVRADIFPEYNREGFERAFRHCFEIVGVREVGSSGRVIYLMANREAP